MSDRTEPTEWQPPELSEELEAEVKRLTADGGLLYTRVHNGLLNMGVLNKQDILRIGRAGFVRPGNNLGAKSVTVIGQIVGQDWSKPSRPLRSVSTDALITELRHRGYDVTDAR